MVGDIFMMNNLEKISPVAIRLLDSTYTMACEKSSVALDKGIKLDNALLVPKLNCNLVSSKLCKQLNCVVTFYCDCCVMQDHTSRILIGVGEKGELVYYYKPTSTSQVNTARTTSLWRKRLGYPSTDISCYLPHPLWIHSNSNNVKEGVCEICVCAKQTYSPFPTSHNNAKDIFDLIHCDFWGTY